VRDYRNKEWLEKKYWGEKLTLTQMGDLVGVHNCTIYAWMEKHGIPRRSTGEANRGKKRPQISEALRGRKRPGVSEAMQGAGNHQWKGGRTYSGAGYVYIKRPSHPGATKTGYVMEHRLVMEEHLGRYLERWETVHHRNGIKDDNRAENLELVVQDVHLGSVVCPHCNGLFAIR